MTRGHPRTRMLSIPLFVPLAPGGASPIGDPGFELLPAGNLPTRRIR